METVMKKQAKDRTNPAATPTEPVVLPDVATTPHPTAATHQDAPAARQGVLEEALPEITAAARKVGGFKKLAEIASQLEDQEGTGQ
jgi:hypothetical protein